MLMIEHSFGVTRACGVIGVSRSLFRYRSRRPDGSNPFLPREVGYYLPHLRHPMVTGVGSRSSSGQARFRRTRPSRGLGDFLRESGAPGRRRSRITHKVIRRLDRRLSD